MNYSTRCHRRMMLAMCLFYVLGSATRPPDNLVGNTGQRYTRQTEKLADGTFGAVYKYKMEGTRGFAAVKMARSDNPSPDVDYALAKAQVQQEYRTLNELQTKSRCIHPNVIEMYDYWARNGCMAMEFLNGKELFEVIDRRRVRGKFMKLPLHRVKKIIRQIVEGVNHIHKNGIAHYDLKPENMMLLFGDVLKIIDFDAADSIHPEEFVFVGTPEYMAPEMLAGEKSYKCDIWAIGIIMVLMLTGEAPFFGYTGDSEEDDENCYRRKEKYYKFCYNDTVAEHRRLDKELSHYAGIVDNEIMDFAMKCLRVNPRKRPDTDALLEHPFLKGTGPGPIPQTRHDRLRKRQNEANHRNPGAHPNRRGGLSSQVNRTRQDENERYHTDRERGRRHQRRPTEKERLGVKAQRKTAHRDQMANSRKAGQIATLRKRNDEKRTQIAQKRGERERKEKSDRAAALKQHRGRLAGERKRVGLAELQRISRERKDKLHVKHRKKDHKEEQRRIAAEIEKQNNAARQESERQKHLNNLKVLDVLQEKRQSDIAKQNRIAREESDRARAEHADRLDEFREIKATMDKNAQENEEQTNRERDEDERRQVEARKNQENEGKQRKQELEEAERLNEKDARELQKKLYRENMAREENAPPDEPPKPREIGRIQEGGADNRRAKDESSGGVSKKDEHIRISRKAKNENQHQPKTQNQAPPDPKREPKDQIGERKRAQLGTTDPTTKTKPLSPAEKAREKERRERAQKAADAAERRARNAGNTGQETVRNPTEGPRAEDLRSCEAERPDAEQENDDAHDDSRSDMAELPNAGGDPPRTQTPRAGNLEDTQTRRGNGKKASTLDKLKKTVREYKVPLGIAGVGAVGLIGWNLSGHKSENEEKTSDAPTISDEYKWLGLGSVVATLFLLKDWIWSFFRDAQKPDQEYDSFFSRVIHLPGKSSDGKDSSTTVIIVVSLLALIILIGVVWYFMAKSRQQAVFMDEGDLEQGFGRQRRNGRRPAGFHGFWPHQRRERHR